MKHNPKPKLVPFLIDFKLNNIVLYESVARIWRFFIKKRDSLPNFNTHFQNLLVKTNNLTTNEIE